MRPLHGNTQPIITGSPTARADEHVVLAFCQKLTIDLFDIFSHIGVVLSGEFFASLHIDYIHHIFRDAVPQRVIAAQQTLLIGNLLQVLVEHLLGVDDGTYLEQV